jgi:diguanylate cyclase (GGDEF)-like protein
MSALSDDQRRILSRIASRLLNLRAGTPVTGLRKTLGPRRSLVDELLSGNLIRIVGGHYLPTFRGIENLEDDIRGIVRGNLDCVFKALQRLYRRSPDHQYTFSFESVVQETKTIDPTRDANDVLPALLLGEEFDLHYFQGGVRQDNERLTVETVTVHERILDFASVETSWKGILAQDEAYRARVLGRSEHALSYNARSAGTFPVTIGGAEKTGSQESMHAAESETDDLLPVFRKRQFENDLTKLLAQSNENTPLSLLFLDLDNFKQVNDQYGHPVGDEVLVGVACALKTVCEGKGHCYRWGGEELVVLLPNYSSAEAVSLGERIRHTVSNLEFHNYPQMMTISVGVACHPETSSGDGLVEHADRALYQAKQKGRNPVCVASPVVGTGARRTRKSPQTSSSTPDVPIHFDREA